MGGSKYTDQCRERCGGVQSQSCNCVESTPSKEMLEGDVMVVTVDMFLDRIIGYQYYTENKEGGLNYKPPFPRVSGY